MSFNIVQRVFQEVREKISPPIQAQTPSIKKAIDIRQNENETPSNMNKSSSNLLGTPSKTSNNLSVMKSQPIRVPKTPQPSRKIETVTPKTPTDSETEIKVFLRVRPLSDNEEHADFDLNGSVVTARPTQKSANHYSERTFTFTDVFNEEADQKEVFGKVAMPLLRRVMHGFDGLLFAYGATSAGKTFTIRGTKDSPGLLPKMRVMLYGISTVIFV